MILFAFILFLANSSFAYRIHSSPYEQYYEKAPEPKMMMAVPSEDDLTWQQYAAPALYQMLDRTLRFFFFRFSIFFIIMLRILERVRRGWGSG
jgi:hypothetical protein